VGRRERGSTDRRFCDPYVMYSSLLLILTFNNLFGACESVGLESWDLFTCAYMIVIGYRFFINKKRKKKEKKSVRNHFCPEVYGQLLFLKCPELSGTNFCPKTLPDTFPDKNFLRELNNLCVI